MCTHTVEQYAARDGRDPAAREMDERRRHRAKWRGQAETGPCGLPHTRSLNSDDDNTELPDPEDRQVAGGGGGGRDGRRGWRVRTSGYKMRKVWDAAYSMVAVVDDAALHTWKLLRADLKSSHHKKQ